MPSLRLPLAPTPENASALAEKAVEAVRQVDGAELDYSQKSLEIIDGIVLEFNSRNLTMSQIGETVFIFGCYVGEVLVRQQGATWEMPDENLSKLGFSMMGVRMPSGTFWNPIGKTIKLLENGQVDSVAYFYVVATEHKP